MKTQEQRDREIDDLWEFVWMRFGVAAGGLITLFASNVGAEAATSSTTYTPLVNINPSPFTTVSGQKFYAACYLSSGGGSPGTNDGLVDLYDLTAGASVLSSVLTISNLTPATIQSSALATPLIVGHSYAVRALAQAGGGGQQIKVQTAYIL
jgi:hypothetical protein